MSKFKVGDKVKIIDSAKRKTSCSCDESETIYLIIDHVCGDDKNYKYSAYNKLNEKFRTCSHCLGNEHLELINKKTFMKKVSIMMKKFLDADTQILVKAGYINGDLELTSEGEKALQTIMFSANKTALVEMAKEDIAEQETNK